MLQRAFQIMTVFVVVAAASSLEAEGDDSKSGEQLANSGAGSIPACSSCHGQNGEGNAAAGFPMLAGMNAGYLASQLNAMQRGQRTVNAAMKPVIDGLTQAQISSVASYYASLPSPAATAESGDISRGKWLVERGDWDFGVPACSQCHAPGAVGVGATFPRLAGQSALYIKNQLTAFRTGARTSDPNGLMKSVAQRMSDEDIESVANYLQTLGVGRAR